MADLPAVHSSAISSIPDRHPGILCACPHSQANQQAFEALESELCTAARLGKALLTRHEAYIADSERERKVMMAQIHTLEGEKQVLEKDNAAAIQQNRDLLDQLEVLNGAVADSDHQVTSLQTTLQATQQELQRVSIFAARAERLEQQIADFEREQASWQLTMDEKDETAKSALRRWQDAQRNLNNVQDELERIEQEAKLEKERHVELMARIERRHTVERELNTAAGRLKGAAALRSAGTESTGTNVVSHFVKDILQDNANLQMGIVELRDMLENSNEEVENLRKKLSAHEPVGNFEIEIIPQKESKRPSLKEEMRRATSNELHVHHHYHAPQATAKPGTLRRPRKKRYGALTADHFNPPSGSSTPRSSVSYGTPSSAAAILQQTAASVPGMPINQRWLTQARHSFSSPNDSSGPGSPQSTHRASSLYDRVFSDAGHDSSRPTTPGTEEPGSPVFGPTQSKRNSRTSTRSHSAVLGHRTRASLDSILDVSVENLPEFDELTPASAIPEEDEFDWENTESPPDTDSSSVAISPLTDALSQTQLFNPLPTLRRAASHESLLSVSGMDIHTLKHRPSQLLTPHAARSFSSTQAVSDTTTVLARPAAMSQPLNSGRSILSGMAAEQRRVSAEKQSLGSRMGGWVFGRWGSTPASSAATTTDVLAPSRTHHRAVSIASGSDSKSFEDQDATPKKPKLRPPGINQSGPIPGFGPEIRRQHPPVVKQLDQDALRDLLGPE